MDAQEEVEVHVIRRGLDSTTLRKRLGVKPFPSPWMGYLPRRDVDIRTLANFMTPEKAEQERVKRKELLWAGDPNDRALGDLLDLAPEGQPADLACCPLTTLNVQTWWGGEALRVFESFDQCWMVHPIFHRDSVPFGQLMTIDVGRQKMRMRRQLERSASPLTVAMGGFELDADYNREVWVPHFHLAVANCTRAQLEGLRAHFKPDGDWEALLQIEEAVNRRRQFAYTAKFVAYRRPFKQHGRKRSGAFRLRLPEHNEYLRFLARLAPTDLLFAMGVTRSNGQEFKITVPVLDA